MLSIKSIPTWSIIFKLSLIVSGLDLVQWNGLIFDADLFLIIAKALFIVILFGIGTACQIRIGSACYIGNHPHLSSNSLRGHTFHEIRWEQTVLAVFYAV